MPVYGYARVSTNRQIENSSIESQIEAIRARFPGVAVFVDDGVSGSVPLFERPAGRELNAKLCEGDTIVLAKLDRGFRSVEDFCRTLEELSVDGIDVSVLNLGGGEPIGKNAIARAMVQMLAVFAELERSMIAERTEEGRAVAKAEGRHLGGSYPYGYEPGVDGKLQPTHWRADAVRYMAQLQRQGFSVRAIAKAVSEHYSKVSHNTVSNILKENVE